LYIPLANIARYLECARTSALGYNYPIPIGKSFLLDVLKILKGESFLVVKSQHIKVLTKLLMDPLTADCALSRVGDSSIVLSQQLVNKKSGQLVVDAAITMVNVNRETGKSAPFPDEMRAITSKQILRPFNSTVVSPVDFASSCVSFFFCEKSLLGK